MSSRARKTSLQYEIFKLWSPLSSVLGLLLSTAEILGPSFFHVISRHNLMDFRNPQSTLKVISPNGLQGESLAVGDDPGPDSTAPLKPHCYLMMQNQNRRQGKQSGRKFFVAT